MITQHISNAVELQIDRKPTGIILRLNINGICQLRICQIPEEMIFNSIDNGEDLDSTLELKEMFDLVSKSI